MQVLTVLACVLSLLVGVNGLAQQSGIGGLTLNTATVTTTTADSATGWNIVKGQSTSAYQGDGSQYFSFDFNATYTGTLLTSAPRAEISFSGTGKLYSPYGCDTTTDGANPSDTLPGVVVYHYYNSPKFTANGAYTGTVTLISSLGESLKSATFTFTVSNAFSPPAAASISSFLLAPTQGSQPPAANITVSPAGSYIVEIDYQAVSAPQGVAWRTTCSTDSNGVCGTWGNVIVAVGGYYCGNYWTSLYGNIPGIDYQKNVAVYARAVSIYNTVSRVTTNFATASLPGNTQTTLSNGDSDSTPPTCTAAAFTPTTLPTDTTNTINVAVTCSDNTGGSGVALVGAFVSFAVGSQTVQLHHATTGASGALTFTVPQHFAGSLTIESVYAVDGAGNTVLYGACPSSPNGPAYDLSSLCGGGSSGSAAIVVSLGMLLMSIMLVVLAL